MQRPPLPLIAVPWSADLACALADASAAVARLDAGICASSLAPAWQLRASCTGYGNALRLQNFEIDEIDIIAHECGLQLAGRPRIETVADPFSALTPWQARLTEKAGLHWRESLPFTFDPPQGWDDAPALVRALTVLDDWARHDRTINQVWHFRQFCIALESRHTLSLAWSQAMLPSASHATHTPSCSSAC